MQATSSVFKTVFGGNDVVSDTKVTVALPIVRRNLCPNPTGVISSSGWAASLSGTAFGPGAFGMGVGWATAGASQYAAVPIVTQPGNVYTAQMVLHSNAGGGTITGGVALGAIGIGQGTPQTTGNVLVTYTFTATGYITMVGVITQGATSGFCDTIVNQFMVEQAGTAGSYFDGSTAGAAWDGTPFISTSTLNVDPYADLSLAVEKIDVTRAMVTDRPDGTQRVTGSPAAVAAILISGLVDQTDATKSAGGLFSPYATDSPLYRLNDQIPGSAVVAYAGAAVGTGGTPELPAIFTGVIDKITYDPQTGIVTLDCVDNRGKMRSASAMPGIGASMLQQNLTGTALVTLLPGLTGLWPLDWLLRANGIYASTSPRGGCAFYASMCGGAWPQIYGQAVPPQADQSDTYSDETAGVDMQFVAGNWTPQVCRDARHGVSLAIPVIIAGLNAGWHAEWGMSGTLPVASVFGGTYPTMTVTLGVMTAGTLASTEFFSLTPVTGTTWAFKANDTTAHNVTIPAGPHVFDVQVTRDTYTLWMDGTQLGQWISANTPPGTVTANYVQTVLPYAVEALQICADPNGVPRTITTPTAQFDASLNVLNAIPDPGTSDAWQIIQQIAEAEGAIAGFDETGLFTFTNRRTLGSGASVRTITSAASLKSLQTETAMVRVATHVTLPVNALQGGAWGNVWNGQGNQQWPTVNGGVYFLHSGETQTLLASWTNPAVIGVLCGVIPGGWIVAAQPLSGYRAARTPDGSGGAITNIQMTVVQTSPTSATITVHNPNPFLAYFTTPPGYPTAQGTPCGIALGGQQFTAIAAPPDGTANSAPSQLVADSQWPPIAEGGAITNPKGDISLPIPANPWVQDRDSAQSFTDDQLVELYLAKPQWTGVQIVADPSLQLADRVTVNDPDASGINEDAIIAALHTVISATDWTQDVDLRAAAHPGYMLLGVPGRCELGQTAYV